MFLLRSTESVLNWLNDRQVHLVYSSKVSDSPEQQHQTRSGDVPIDSTGSYTTIIILSHPPPTTICHSLERTKYLLSNIYSRPTIPTPARTKEHPNVPFAHTLHPTNSLPSFLGAPELYRVTSPLLT